MGSQQKKELLRFTTAVPALVVCPDPETRNSLFAFITKCGLPCVCCSDLAIARSLLTSRPFGVVFCNDAVPDGNFRFLRAGHAREHEGHWGVPKGMAKAKLRRTEPVRASPF